MKITKCPPGPMDPELTFQRYAFDKDLGEAPGVTRSIDSRDPAFIPSREIRAVVATDFLEGLVLQALVDCHMPEGEAIQLIKEINGEQE